MGDPKRFDLLAQCINYHFGDKYFKRQTIYDIAGGRGYLQASLRERGYKDVLTWEPSMRPERVRERSQRFRPQLFHWQKAPNEAGLIIGMHPDEATDHIVMYARENLVPFVVCPCCIKPTASTFWGRHDEERWLGHLERLAKGIEVKRINLKMDGRNTVLIGRP